MKVSDQDDAPAALPPVRNHGTHSIGGWAGLEQVGTLIEQKNLLPLPGFQPRAPPPLVYVLYYLRIGGKGDSSKLQRESVRH
jgi:hypothetical protein